MGGENSNQVTSMCTIFIQLASPVARLRVICLGKPEPHMIRRDAAIFLYQNIPIVGTYNTAVRYLCILQCVAMLLLSIYGNGLVYLV